MAPRLNQDTALKILLIVEKLGKRASFGNILLEAHRRGVISFHRTLRRYLDLLTQAKVLKVTERDVGSVNPQQLYNRLSPKAHLWTGLEALRIHGLNWDIPANQLYRVTTDLEAMLRARTHIVMGKERLLTGLEDTIVCELKRDIVSKTGTIELLAAMLATRPVDLPYLLRRADSQEVGVTFRHLFRKIMDTFTSLPGDTEGRPFLEARDRFLKTLRYYNSSGAVKLVQSRGRGSKGEEIVRALSSDRVALAASKQAGGLG